MMRSLYHSFIHKVLVQHNLDQKQNAFKSFLLIYDCMKVMCETDSLGSKIVVVFCGFHHHLYRFIMMIHIG